MASKKNSKKSQNLEEEADNSQISTFARRWLYAVIVWGIAIIFILSILGQAGAMGKYIELILDGLLGWGRYVIPIIMLASGLWIVREEKITHPYYRVTGIFVMFISALSISALFSGGNGVKIKILEARTMGGYAGLSLAYLSRILGFWGGFALLFTFFVVGIILLLDSFIADKKNKEEILVNQKTEIEKEEAHQESFSDSVQTEENKEELEKKNIFTRVLDWRKKDKQKEAILKEFEQKEKGNVWEKIRKQPPEETKKETQNIPIEKSVLKPEITQLNWKYPPFNILEKTKSKAIAEDIKKNTMAIKNTLINFGIPTEIADVNVGPTVTQYAARPAEGIKLSRITALQNDLAMSLAAHPIRIEAPIPGRSLVGIEVPNKVKRVVSLREILESPTFNESKDRLLIALGEDVAGNYVYSDLAEMPHLLIAGSTGSGKSIGINCLIASLLYRNSPKDMRVILVDPKRVELSVYNDIPHLLTPVIMDPPKVANALKWAVSEMERRYILIQETMSRNIVSYNSKITEGEIEPEVDQETGEIIEPEFLPYVVIIIDELADLMSSPFAKEIESLIVRLAQMSRAVGIHLVLSTQRPSVNVITGIIKANFPTRMAFQVVSQIDSRTILDMSGAEKLLGKGDMLYLARESNQPRRIQGAYVSEKEIRKMVEYLINQEAVQYDPTVTKAVSSSNGISGENEEDEDEFYEEAVKIVTREKRASTSLLQRHLRIGYARAARLMDFLEREGIVGPAEGSKPRQVLTATPKEATDYEDPLSDQVKRDQWN